MAQERCVRKTAQHGRLWLPGEVRTIDAHDESGRPIVSPHFRLVESDEMVSEDEVYSPEDVAVRRREAGLRDKRAAITQALRALDPEDNSHWTRKGEPSLQKVFGLTSFEVSRAVVREVWPDFDRDVARELRKPPAA